MKVLTISRNYPNDVLPGLGLWVKELVQATAELIEQKVVAPVPYVPPLPRLPEDYARFRRIPPYEQKDGTGVTHPRILTGPGQLFFDFEAKSYYWTVFRHVDEVRQEFPFDLIHAHLAYPDGVVAVRLGRRYQVPVIITEHAMWQPWMENYPRVRRQSVWAVQNCSYQIVASGPQKDSITQVTDLTEKVRIITYGLDPAVFFAPTAEEQRNPNQILFVGRLEPVKALHILIQAFAQLVKNRPEARLVLVGASLYEIRNPEEQRLRALVEELGLVDSVEFAGFKPPVEVAEIMRESALLALSSHRESFGSVLIEALACGTPIVATLCGGPEDVVNDQVGLLVPTEDVDAFASAMDHILNHRDRYPPARLSAYAQENYSWERIAKQTVSLYQEALDRFQDGNGPRRERRKE